MRRALWLAACVATSALAAEKPSELISLGTRQLDAMQFDLAQKTFEQLLALPELAREHVKRGYEGLALSAAVVHDDARSEWAFKRLLSMAPDWQPPGWFSARAPFERAEKYWFTRSPPQLRVKHAPEFTPGLEFTVSLDIPSDPLGTVQTIRVQWSTETGGGVLETQTPMVEIPGKALTGNRLELTLRGLNDKRATVLELEPIQIPATMLGLDVSAPLIAAPEPAAGEGATAKVSRRDEPEDPAEWGDTSRRKVRWFRRSDLRTGRLSLYGEFFTQVLNRGLGGSMGLTCGLTRWLSIGAGATAGSSFGGEVHLALEPFTSLKVVHPRLSLRGTANPWNKALVLGGGGQLGAAIDLGPGRAVAGFAVEAYAVPEGLNPLAGMFTVAYELDVVAPAPVN